MDLHQLRVFQAVVKTSGFTSASQHLHLSQSTVSQHIRELGEINPDHVVTPGIFVDRVLHMPYGDPTGF